LETLDGMRNEAPPLDVRFTTTTLKYNKSHWVTVHALQEHWKPARIQANRSQRSLATTYIKTENIAEFSVEFAANEIPADSAGVTVFVTKPRKSEQTQDPGRQRGQPREENNLSQVNVSRRSDLSCGARLRLGESGDWELVSPIKTPSKELRKQHGLQGPIDDAFMGPFLFVKPSATGRYPEVDKWVDAEFNRAVREWHRQMRGDARVKTSEELKPEDIENYHLVLWGDPQSNPTLARIAEKLPIAWSAEHVVVGDRKFDAKTHAPVLIYPNPLNPEKYVVLNSCFTYREYDYLNNARQVPKLPDWAVIDLTTPPNSRWPGKIAAADFFGEKWELKPVTP
jgi:hypothetical protein